MTTIKERLLDEFQIRKSKKQKAAFRAWLRETLEKEGCTVSEEKGNFSTNVVVGNPDKAKVIFTAHYDTCAVLPIPNFITPRNFFLYLLYQLILSAIMLAIIFGSEFALMFLWEDCPLWAALLAVYAAAIFCFWWLMDGPANKHTANDNTSGVITLLEIYEKLTEEQKKTVCLVFFDNEEQGLLGSAQFRKCYKKSIKETLMINFDCVSDGDTFLFGISKAANQKYHVALSRAYASTAEKQVLLENLKKIYYPSDQAGFPMAVAVAALKYKKPFGYYMDRIHTKRDTVFQEENIAYLAERTVQLIEQI